MIQKFEELAMNAYPALHTTFVNGWILRFAGGYSKRANSVSILHPCSIDILENIALCEAAYNKQGISTVFKLAEGDSAYNIDKLLENRGYVYEARTNVMQKCIQNFQLAEQDKAGVNIYTEHNDEWFAAYTLMNKVKEKDKQTLKSMFEKITADKYYACLMDADKIIAVGLGVAERGYIGLYGIYVNDEYRRRGLGETLVKNLVYKGLQNGCQYTYLLVVDDNEPAKALYDKLGYQHQYSYWYRVKKFDNK